MLCSPAEHWGFGGVTFLFFDIITATWASPSSDLVGLLSLKVTLVSKFSKFWVGGGTIVEVALYTCSWSSVEV